MEHGMNEEWNVWDMGDGNKGENIWTCTRYIENMDNGWVYEYIFDRRWKKGTEGKVWDLWNPGIFGYFEILFGFVGGYLYV